MALSLIASIWVGYNMGSRESSQVDMAADTIIRDILGSLTSAVNVTGVGGEVTVAEGYRVSSYYKFLGGRYAYECDDSTRGVVFTIYVDNLGVFSYKLLDYLTNALSRYSSDFIIRYKIHIHGADVYITNCSELLH